MLGVKNIDIQDILYGGHAGELPHPDLSDLLLSEPKQSQEKPRLLPEQSVNKNENVIAPQEIASAVADASVDIRPRIFDGASKEFILLDTGSQVSTTKPGPNDVIMEKMSLLMTIAENVKNLTFLALVLLGFICMLPEIVFWSKSCCNCSSKQEVIKPLK